MKPKTFKIGSCLAHVPPGQYKVKVVDIHQTKYMNKRPTLEFEFEIVDCEYRGTKIRGFVNADYETFSAYTKLYKWYFIATGDELGYGDEGDFSEFEDKIFLAEVETKESRKTKNQFSNVTDLISLLGEI